MNPNIGALGLTVILIVATVIISLAARLANTTATDFYLAGRRVNYFINASAICGDYFSAASFLGVAGAVYASGLDGVWFGAGFGAAFVPVLIFFASPIRRFGEYTIPDFLAARFQSPAARVLGVLAVQAVCIFYLVPQMVGAGATWQVLVGTGFLGMDAYTTGVVLTVTIMGFYVTAGGMRGTTWNQMVEFWILAAAMIALAALTFVYGFSYASALENVSKGPLTAPAAYQVRDLTSPGPDGRTPAELARSVMNREYWEAKIQPKLTDPEATVVVLIPQTSKITGQPMVFTEPGHRYSWLDQFSMVLALVLGTSGLPHIMNRYYTNPTGKVARWTTVAVLGMVGVFYIAASIVGLAGRAMIPELAGQITDHNLLRQVVSGVLVNSDSVMPFLAQALGGDLGLGVIAAGAFAAMFSTIGGLLLASAASWGHDLYDQFIAQDAPEWKKVAVGKAAVLLMSGVALAVGLGVPASGLMSAYPSLIALMVTWAFSVAGGFFVPVLLTSIWWKQITLTGALAGMIVGGGGSVLFIICNILRATRAVSPDSLVYWIGQLAFPAAITFPLAVAIIFVISYLDRRNLPSNIDEIWIRIHGTARERQQRRLERLSKTDPVRS